MEKELYILEEKPTFSLDVQRHKEAGQIVQRTIDDAVAKLEGGEYGEKNKLYPSGKSSRNYNS